MPETLEELTYDYEDEGVLVRKQIDRAVLTKGSWATVMFLFQELDRAKGKFRPPKMAIVRFKKSKGSYRKQSSFNISNEKQARQITEVLEGWYPKIAEMTAEMTAETGRRATGDGEGDEERGRRRVNGERGRRRGVSDNDRRHRQPALARQPAQPPHRRRIPGDRRRCRAGCSPPRRWRSWMSWRRELRQAAPAVIAIHGGDGTLHRTVTALDRAFGADPMPPIAILCGGTMNVVATSLRHPRAAVGLPDRDRRGDAAPASRSRRSGAAACASASELGFLFGSGLPANFLAEYYGPGGYGPARAAWLLVRAFFSALWQGPFVRKLFKRFEGSVRVDGALLEQTAFVGLLAGTVREVGLGFKLVHRADDDPERFGVLAMHSAVAVAGPRRVAVQRGRGISTKRAFSAVASQMDVHSTNGSMAYTIDGDLYRTQEPVAISLGPPIVFLKPPSALIVRPRGDTMGGQR